MSTPPNQQSEEYLAARIESCKLLGLDPDNLTAHEAIRADLATVLRLWLDGSQSTLLSGGSADPVKLLSVVEALTKLVPEREQRSRGEGPREAMLRTYMEMRRRGELADPTSTYEGMKAEVERLKARVAELEAALAGRAPAESTVPPLPDNVVSLRNDNGRPPAAPPSSEAAAPKSAPAAPVQRGIITDDEDQPWRPFVGGGSRRDPWADNRS
jgi:hypothetical protein